MRENIDWLSQLLQIITVTGELEIRCAYGAPWRISYERSQEREIPFHVVLSGTAILENMDDRSSRRIGPGDIVLLPHGSAHALHDGSGSPPSPAQVRETANFAISENFGSGERLDMLCGRFIVEPPHDRLIKQYLPGTLVASSRAQSDDNTVSATGQLTSLVHLMRLESFESRLGGFAMLNALSSALFTLMLRVASESLDAPTGLLALAGHPRLSPAISAMLQNPAEQWTLPKLAQLCNMSRATFMRHFEALLGRSATDLLADVRMSIAANALKNPTLGTESVADLVGYQSTSAFRRAFTQRTGVTPSQWRRTMHQTVKSQSPTALDRNTAGQTPLESGQAESIASGEQKSHPEADMDAVQSDR